MLICAAMAALVYVGEAPWWLMLAAIYIASQTANSVRELRAYNGWAERWQAMAMGTAVAPPKPRRKKHPALDNAVGMVAVVALPWLASQMSDRTERLLVAYLWLAVCVLLIFRFVRGVVRFFKARRTQQSKAESIEIQPVSWLVDRASSSPSRAEAMRQLPEYSGRLIGKG
jgi:peptidoglycan/LPS O-acetylase OafA/YrhL